MIATIAIIAPELSRSGKTANLVEILAPFLCIAGTESTLPSPVSALPRRDRAAISPPMAVAQTLRNGEIKRLADGLGRGVAENTLGPGIPKADDAVSIGRDDCFRA
jgi:hypothetical protein